MTVEEARAPRLLRSLADAACRAVEWRAPPMSSNSPTPAPAGATPEPQHGLARVLTLRDVVLFNVVAVLGLRWVSTAARAGPGTLVLWILAAALFFVPQGLAVLALSERSPAEGGIYAWTRETLGEGHGFLCGWCYWINNVLFYPNLLIATAVIATWAVGKGTSGLADSRPYVLIVSLAGLWLAVGINIVGTGTGKWLQNVGGLGTYVPALMLVAVGIVAVVNGPPANALTRAALTPKLSHLATLNLWATIAFAFAGLELSATMAGEVRDPTRTMPRAVFISAPLIAAAYILGTAAMLWIVPAAKVNIASGFIQGISEGASRIAPGLGWLGALAAALYAVGNLGGVGAWLVGPARVAFVIGLDRYFPPAFGRLHPKYGTPYVAILVPAALASVLLVISLLGKGTTVDRAYLILLDMNILLFFIPYLYLFVVFLRQFAVRSDGATIPSSPARRRVTAWLLGMSGLLVTGCAMILAGIPPEGGEQAVLFLVKVLGGTAAFLLLGWAIYRRGASRAAPMASVR